jgi:ligand-binding sensor domain-containing protein
MNNKFTLLKKLLFIIFIISIISTILFINKKNEPIPHNNVFTTFANQIDIMSLGLHNNILYAGTPDGLFKVSGSYPTYNLEKVTLINNLTFIRSIYTDNENNLWIGASNGLLCILPDESEIFYTEENSLIPDNRVNYIIQTSDDSIWVGTWGGAICFKNDGNSKIYTTKNGLLKDMVNVIVEDYNEGIWFASYNVRSGGISYLKNNKFSYYNQDNGLINTNITSFIFKDTNELWFGSGIYESGGITVFELSENIPIIKKTYEKDDGFAGIKVRSLYIDNDTIIIGSEYDGIALWNDSKKIYTIEDGLPNNEVKTFAKYNDILFLGTRSGLCFFNPEEYNIK